MRMRLFLLAAPVLMLLMVSCRKHTTPPVVVPVQPPAVNQLSKLEYSNKHLRAIYLPDGRIDKIVNTYLPANDSAQYHFLYADGKLAEIRSRARWKYLYTGDKITAIETYNESDVLRYRSEFTYSNNLVTEKNEFLVTSAGAFPYFRTFYTYHPNGNLLKKEVYQYVNDGWAYEEHVLYPEYDNQPNYAQPFENQPYQPSSLFGGNNPLKEVFMHNNTVTLTVVYSYTYDEHGRPKSRTALYQSTVMPDYSETVKLFY